MVCKLFILIYLIVFNCFTGGNFFLIVIVLKTKHDNYMLVIEQVLVHMKITKKYDCDLPLLAFSKPSGYLRLILVIFSGRPRSGAITSDDAITD